MANRTGEKIDDYSAEYYQSSLRYIDNFEFVNKEFVVAPALVTQLDSGKKAERYRGQAYRQDGSQWVVPDGWDHEHCYVCWWKILAGDSYWENAGGKVLLCDECYKFISTDERHGKR